MLDNSNSNIRRINEHYCDSKYIFTVNVTYIAMHSMCYELFKLEKIALHTTYCGRHYKLKNVSRYRRLLSCKSVKRDSTRFHSCQKFSPVINRTYNIQLKFFYQLQFIIYSLETLVSHANPQRIRHFIWGWSTNYITKIFSILCINTKTSKNLRFVYLIVVKRLQNDYNTSSQFFTYLM